MTKSHRTWFPLIFLAAALSVTSASAQTDAQKAFSAIKNMPGMWEGKTPEDSPCK